MRLDYESLFFISASVMVNVRREMSRETIPPTGREIEKAVNIV